MTEFEIMKDCFTKSKMNIQVKENEIDHIVMWDKDNNMPTYIIKFFFNERGMFDHMGQERVTIWKYKLLYSTKKENIDQ